MTMFKTPIVIFIFNRPDCTQSVFSSIAAIQPERLFIVADGPRDGNIDDEQLCAAARLVTENISWPCDVSRKYSTKNIGCRNSIPAGLNWVFEQVEECIILEDDCLPQVSFFQYCEELLARYKNDSKVMTIGGHRSDGPNEFDGDSYFFSKYPSIWGWATWKNKWLCYDLAMQKWDSLRGTSWLRDILKKEEAVAYWRRMFDKMQNGFDTWDYALVYSSWLHNFISIRPKVNMIANIGFNDSATHTKSEESVSAFQIAADLHFPLVHPLNIAVNESDDERIEWVSFSGMDKRILNNLREKVRQKKEERELNILHVATYDEFGGAARATQRIYKALNTQALCNEMLVMHKTSSDNSIRKPLHFDEKANLKLMHQLLASYRIQKSQGNNVLQSYGEASAGIVEEVNGGKAAVVHLYWICNFLSIEDIARIEKPIVWTFHDMWAFAGSEHVSYDVDAYFYKDSSAVNSNELSMQTWSKKRDLWKHKDFNIVVPCKWLANCVARSVLFQNSSIHIIPYPIDVHFWTPQSQQVARNMFNFSGDKKLLLFIAKNPLNDRNKGWDLLQESLLALHAHSSIDFELVLVGHEGAIDTQHPFVIHNMGEINDDKRLVQLYSAVDLLVVPSRVEGLPQVCVEAQACGLPIVGFNIGGIPDIINHNITGWVSQAYDTRDFSAGAQWILEDDKLRIAMSQNARKHVLDNYSHQVVAKQYYDVYKEILSKNSKNINF
jgi:glycosyltransferase involved in cell wall biosynthesis